MVSIVGPLYKYIIRACSVPAMKCGHQSATIRDLGNLTLALGALNVEKEYLPEDDLLNLTWWPDVIVLSQLLMDESHVSSVLRASHSLTVPPYL